MARLIKQLLSSHLYALFDYLDPVSKFENSKFEFNQRFNRKWDFKFVFPPLAIFLAFLHGCFYMVYNSHGYWDMETMLSSSLMGFHQAFPKKMWPQTDVTCLIAGSTAVAVYISFWRRPYSVERYFIDESKNLSIRSEGLFYISS